MRRVQDTPSIHPPWLQRNTRKTDSVHRRAHAVIRHRRNPTCRREQNCTVDCCWSRRIAFRIGAVLDNSQAWLRDLAQWGCNLPATGSTIFCSGPGPSWSISSSERCIREGHGRSRGEARSLSLRHLTRIRCDSLAVARRFDPSHRANTLRLSSSIP